MKKTIVVIILAVYIASIAVVNFFGLEVKVFDGITYVESIQCDTVILRNEDSKELYPVAYLGTNGDIPLFEFTFIPKADGTAYTDDDESIVSNPNAIELNYVVFPHLADEQGVKFEYDEESMNGLAIFREDIRTLVFLKPGIIFTVTIKATDGSNKSTTVAIRGKLPQVIS
jgi:hypothetical protein